MSLGRLFHTFAPATGKAGGPLTVDRRQVGTSGEPLSQEQQGMSRNFIEPLSLCNAAEKN